ncbi:uncharacterized protein LOC103578770 isoform X1 [Microplitis demolitor]|uniref:uncharacterized protein LOC103578770 isoform X1 n=1 Tax=Microplitis demolitor TaxID=69319 RepID=UPI0004CCF4DC|nr:uncharacterized protein LOC103578770 isoform X1 [Microplitis demolitor]
MQSKVIIIFMTLVSLTIGAVVKKEDNKTPTDTTKKDKRGLIDLGYGYAYTPDISFNTYPYSSISNEYAVPVSHQSVSVEKHIQLPQVQYQVYERPYGLKVTKHLPVAVAQTYHPVPIVVKVPDTYAVPYVKRVVGITHPVIVSK